MKKWIISLLWLTNIAFADGVLSGPNGIHPVKTCKTLGTSIKIIPCFGGKTYCKEEYPADKFQCHNLFKTCSDSLLNDKVEIVNKNINNSMQRVRLFEAQGRVHFTLDKSQLDFDSLEEVQTYFNKNLNNYEFRLKSTQSKCPPNY